MISARSVVSARFLASRIDSSESSTLAAAARLLALLPPPRSTHSRLEAPSSCSVLKSAIHVQWQCSGPHTWLQLMHTTAHRAHTATTTTAAAASAATPPEPNSSDVFAGLEEAVAVGGAGEGEVEGEAPTCVCVTLAAVPGATAELLSDALLGEGATSVVVVQHRAPGVPEQEIFEEPGSGAAGVWDLNDLVVYFPLAHDVRGSVEAAAEVVGLEQPCQWELLIKPVHNREWVEQIKASYQPLQVSRSLYIVPEWSSPTDPGALNIVLQPGVAFGTGEHPTTRLCLTALEATRGTLRGASVVDYGTGSGVLALAALLLGAAAAVGTDTDPLAVRSAGRNAELTGVGNRFTSLLCGPHLDDPEPLAQAGYPLSTFDVVCANILRGPLIELQPRLTAYCRPGGLLLLSGILAEQVPDVQRAYEPHFESFDVSLEGAWACVSAVRKPHA